MAARKQEARGIARKVDVSQAAGRHSALALAAFFFLAEMSSYLVGVLSRTLLVNRAGVEMLPYALLVVNFLFMPILILVMLSPPRSSSRLVQGTLIGYLGILLVLSLGIESTRVVVLCFMYVVARVGKFLWGIFAVGIVTEVLPLRETKTMGPKIMAASAGGIVFGEIALRPSIELLGLTGTYLCIWGVLLISVLILSYVCRLNPADVRIPTGKVDAKISSSVNDSADGSGASTLLKEPLGVYSFRREKIALLRGIVTGFMKSSLARIIGMMELSMVAIRNLADFIYAHALGEHFTSAETMASFSGTFEATMMISVIGMQFMLSGYLLRTFRVGVVAILFPGILALASLGSWLHTTFAVTLACFCCYVMGSEVFYRPVRQVLVAGIPGAKKQHTLVTMALMGGTGAFLSSVALVPLAKNFSIHYTIGLLFLVASINVLVALKTGGVYMNALTEAVDQGVVLTADEAPAEFTLGDDESRYAALKVMVGAPDPEFRIRAAEEIPLLTRYLAIGLLKERLLAERDPEIQGRLVTTTKRTGSRGIEDALIFLADDADPRVQSHVIEALGDVAGNPQVLSLVRDRLISESARVRAAAVLGLVGRCGDSETIEIAASALRGILSPDSSEQLRAAAASVMGKLGHSFFVPELLDLIADPSPSVRAASIRALTGVSDPSIAQRFRDRIQIEDDAKVLTLLEQGVKRIRDGAIDSLVQIGDGLDSHARSRLVATISGTSDDTKIQVLLKGIELENLGDVPSLIALVKSCDDRDLILVIRRILTASPDASGCLIVHDLLKYLSQRGPDQCPQGYVFLKHFLPASDPEESVTHVARIVTKLWKAVALESVLMSGDIELHGPEQDPDRVDRIRDDRRRWLAHVVALASMFTTEPDRTLKALRAVLAGDQHLSSLSMAILEQWLPPDLQKELFEILAQYSEQVRREAFAYSQCRLPRGKPREIYLDILEGEMG